MEELGIEGTAPTASLLSTRRRPTRGTVLVSRFRIERTLGLGSSGRVYAALDESLESRVALKWLGHLDAEAVLDVKAEFRAACELVHPNLVRLHELFYADGAWFFTMDLIEGASLAEVLERSSPPSPERTRRWLGEVASALDALHRSGTVHGDLNPHNVLIRQDDERALLLDFGLSSPVGSAGSAGGTPAYAAPELWLGGAKSEATDWYAFGVLVYKTLTGTLPIGMPSRRRLASSPSDLAALCESLLNLDSGRRADGPTVLEHFAPSRSTASRRVASSATTFVNRAAELDALSEALAGTLEGRAESVVIHGSPGMGKTALLSHFAERCRAQGAIVLQGRCREKERIAFKAVDGLIDDLIGIAETLGEPPLSELEPPHRTDLVRLFPALQALWSKDPKPPTAARALARVKAIDAFVELFRLLRLRRPLVVCIDDMQWGDSESALLLGPLLRGPRAVPLLLVATTRGAPDQPAFLAELQERPPLGFDNFTSVSIDRLGEDDATLLAASLLPSETPAAESRAREIARDAEGHPWFVVEIAEQGSAADESILDVQRLVRARLDRLSERENDLLRLVALAGAPLPRPALQALGEWNPAELQASLDVLHAARLLRSSGRDPSTRFEIFDDRTRDMIGTGLSLAHKRRVHTRLAETLATVGGVKHEVLAEHCQGSGQLQQAAIRWLQASEDALAALAFDHAAALLERALALLPSDDPSRWRVEERLAEARSDAGRGAAAADTYLALAQRSQGPQALEYRRRAAEQLLLSGHLEDGLELLDTVARALGVVPSRTPLRALVQGAAGRTIISLRGLEHRLKANATLNENDKVRLEVFWTIACSTSLIDPIFATPFHNRHLLLALKSGQALAVVRALSLEALYVATFSTRDTRGNTPPRVHDLLAALDRAATTVDTAEALGTASLGRGIAEYLGGYPSEAVQSCNKALEYFAQLRGVTWETLSAQRFVIAGLFYSGRFRELAEFVPPLMERAVSTGNRYAYMCFGSAFGTLAWLTLGDIQGARTELVKAEREVSKERFDLTHYNLILGKTLLDLYQSNVESAYTRLKRNWANLEKNQLLRVGLVATQAHQLLAAAAVALAGQATRSESRTRASLLDEARALSSSLRRKPVSFAMAQAQLLDAALACSDRHYSQAIDLLYEAKNAFSELGFRMFEAAINVRLGQIAGDTASSTAGLNALVSENVFDPYRMVNLLAPGFEIAEAGR